MNDANGAAVLLVEDDRIPAHRGGAQPGRTRLPGHRGCRCRRGAAALAALAAGPRAAGSGPARSRRHWPCCGRSVANPATGVIVLSARGEEASKVEALEGGADDYLTKPFGMPELHARMRSVLRRAAGPAADAEGVVHNGRLTLDVDAHKVRVAGVPVSLTPREFAILAVLLAHPGRLVTRGRHPAGGVGRGVPRRGPLRSRLRQPDPSQALGSGRRVAASTTSSRPNRASATGCARRQSPDRVGST